MSVQGDELSMALILYTGWGFSRIPHADSLSVIDRLGMERGKILVDTVNEILRGVVSMSIDQSMHTRASAMDLVRNYTHAKYPHLSEEALMAVVWTFTFDLE